jgi:subtilase family serine protease
MRNRKKIGSLLTMSLVVLGASAQQEPGVSVATGDVSQLAAMPSVQSGNIYVPESSKPPAPGKVRTTYVIRSRDGNRPSGAQTLEDESSAGLDGTIEMAEAPCSLGSLYVASPSTPCIPSFNAKGGPSSAGYGAIALVDAYDNPDAASDLANFDSHFGLAAASFTKIYANGNNSCKTPPANADWSIEESLDIEWAHVFAPKAAIVLVEACSNSYSDLFYAEQVAFQYIVSHYPQGGQVSNSWQGAEFAGQIADDSLFADFTYNSVTGYKTPIVALASAGDSGAGVGYPSTNPWVISAGGTSILRDASTQKFSSESCWGGSGGGVSSVETYETAFSGGHTGPWADFQYPIFGQGSRGTPDLSFDADPASGVFVLSQYGAGGWLVVGGTSVSSPSLAGIINRSGNRIGSVHINAVTGNAWFTTGENNLLYAQLPAGEAYPSNFYDVKTGSNGKSAVAGWDYCTGVGSPRGLLGK